MGANAGTAVPTYASGDVLTAANLNLTNCGVPVFATTTTRDAAFGGTGEKTLAEGQLCYVEGTGLQTYNGTSWVTWGALPGDGLTLISSTTIGSAVSSVTVSSAFSSTYDNYCILINGGVASTNFEFQLRLGSVSAEYRENYIYMTTDSTTITGAQTNGSSAFPVVGYGSVNTLNARIDLFGPNLAKNTVMHFQAVRSVDAGRNAVGQGMLVDTTQFTAFTLFASTGTMTGGTIKVYGYKN